MSRIPTPHINAPEGAFARTVLMPGDPLRSKYIAEHYLEDAQLVVMYAAWMWRRRDSQDGMPRMLRWALNNRIMSEKMQEA